MNCAALDFPHRSEFDRFLFTQLGEDRNGVPLSVVSLLARMNLDPWQEAQTLAQLPAEAAATRLAFSLDTLTDPLLRQLISELMVRRLLALLPKRAPVAVATPAASGHAVAAHDHATRIHTIVFITSTLVLLVGSQILAEHRFAPTARGVVPGSAAAAAPAPTLPISSGH